MITEFKTRVGEIIERIPGVKSFQFPRPENFDFDPGQWMFITLFDGDEKKRKHFTISSSPTEREFIEFTKKITDHEFSVLLDTLHPGDRVDIDGPYGNFTFKGEYPRVGMITGGIGITPLRSIIRYCTDSGVSAQITLLYGNRNEESIVFREELEDLMRKNPSLQVIHCLSRPGDGWKGRKGHVDMQLISEEIPDYGERIFYVSGPSALVNDIVQALKILNIPDAMVRTEQFPGY
jgi:ferredoxin-NADP reductase